MTTTPYEMLSDGGKIIYWKNYHSVLSNFRNSAEKYALNFLKKRRITIELRTIENKIFELMQTTNN